MEEDLFDVFRIERPSIVWIGSTDSVPAAHELIRSKAAGPKERFIIFNVVTHERVYLRADECARRPAD